MVDEIINYFPFDSFRTGQEESIRKILDAIENGCEYVILDAPTGSGKSSIARTVVDYLHETDFNGYSIQIDNELIAVIKSGNKYSIWIREDVITE